MAKCVIEAREYIEGQKKFYAQFNLDYTLDPMQVVEHCVKMAYRPEQIKFPSYFESLPVCTCGILRGVVTKLLCHVAQMMILGFTFGIQTLEEVIKEGDSLTSIGVSYEDQQLNEGQFTEIEVGQVYDYFGIGAFVEINDLLLDSWVGGDQDGFIV